MNHDQNYPEQSFVLRDAAKYIGVKPLTLCDMVRAGEIEAIPTTGEPRVLISDLYRYMAKRAGVIA